LSENHTEYQKSHISFVEIGKYGYKPLELADKQIFSQKFSEIQPDISEYNFTNLYMWREYYQYVWKQKKNGDIILLALFDPTKIIAFPIIGTDITWWIDELDHLKVAFNQPIEIHRISESLSKKVQEIYPNLKTLEDRDNWDYLYKRSDLVDLPGKDYANIRRKLNKFMREYQIEVEPITKENANLCLQLQEEWCNLRACEDTPSLDNEDKAIRDILLHIDQLDFIGFIVKYDERVIGYSIGEKLNDSTVIIHVEKGDTEYYGLYQALNHIFAEKFASEFEYINREQDLGVPGLRRSKESYHPMKFIKKFIIEFK
jgi:uncharacterized protein